MKLRERANQNGIDFLLTTSTVANPLRDVAGGSQSEEKTARRNHNNARNVHDTVIRPLPKLSQ
jgi:hypothetical protein